MGTLLRWASRVAALAFVASWVAAIAGSRRFAELARAEVEGLLARATPPADGVVIEAMLREFPDPVRRYLSHSGIVGRPFVSTVHLTQSGRIRLDPGQPWIPFRAEQRFTVNPPGFVWEAVVPADAVPLLRAVDTYRDGKGHMLITALGLYPLVDATGPELDQGEMVRYLSEMTWFPASFLAESVAFEAIDGGSARVSLTHAGLTVGATMTVDDVGRLVSFEADRYSAGPAGMSIERWRVAIDEYGVRAGLRIPVRARAMWRLADGDEEYIDVRVEDLRLDP